MGKQRKKTSTKQVITRQLIINGCSLVAEITLDEWKPLNLLLVEWLL